MRQRLLGFVLFFSIIVLLLHPSGDGPDAQHYLAWGQSIFYDGNLSLLNQFKGLHIADYYFTPTGLVGELRNFGLGLFWQPFYALSAPYISAQNGDKVQVLFLTWSTLLCVLLACSLMLAALQQLYSPKTAWIAVILLCVGTPVAFYTVQQPISAHPASLCLAALFLLLCLKTDKIATLTAWRYFGAGIVAGWLMLLATYNLVVLLLPLTQSLGEFIAHRKWRRFLLNNSALGLGAFLGFLPQMVVWHLLYGNLLATPYARQMQWSQPYLWEVLLSPFHGLLVYAPMLFLVPVGLILLARQNKALAIGIGLSWLGLTYFVGANLAWWAGTSFGNRYFLVLSPFFVLALGALLQQSYRWLWLLIPACLWTLGLWLEYAGHNVMLISPNRYYAFLDLVTAQTRVWQNLMEVVFALPQHWFSETPVLVSAEILLLSAGGYVLGYYGLRWLGMQSNKLHAYLLGTLSLCLIGYVILLGYRTESQQNRLTATALAKQAQRVSTYDPLDLGQSYMERAKYHFAIQRPDLALIDAQKAAKAWPSAEREIVGYAQLVSQPLSRTLDVPYGAIHLLGYQWQAPNKLVLYWQKVDHDSKNIYNPLIQIKGAGGKTIGQSQLNDPFPATLISKGYIFCDHFVLPTQLSVDQTGFAITFPDEKLESQEFYPIR